MHRTTRHPAKASKRDVHTETVRECTESYFSWNKSEQQKIMRDVLCGAKISLLALCGQSKPCRNVACPHFFVSSGLDGRKLDTRTSEVGETAAANATRHRLFLNKLSGVSRKH